MQDERFCGVVFTGEKQQSGRKFDQKMPQNGVPKNGFGDRQVGAFCKNRLGDTGIPFIFSRKSLFFRKMCRFRG